MRRRRDLGDDRGLTLAEMLVTLAIMGVMAGVAVLGMGAVDRTVGAEIEARRLAARLSLAVDQATVDRRAQVFRWDADGWSVAPVGDPGVRTGEPERHELAGGLRLTLDRAEAEIALAPDGVGQPFEATVSGGVDRWRVVFDGLRAAAAPAGETRS